MHGFNEGETLISDACKNYSCKIIYTQKHWLTPGICINLMFLKISFLLVMENEIESHILAGRSYGDCLK